MSSRLDLDQALRDRLIEHALEAYPQEACGFVTGRNQRASRIISLPNTAQDPQHVFDVAPDKLLQVFRNIEAEDEALIAIYHSHPHSTAVPSEHDVRHAALHYPYIPQIIIGLRPSLDIKAWLVAQGQLVQVKIVIRDETDESLAKSLTAVQVVAVLIVVILSLIVFFTISLSLLPPAPPIPTPAG